MSEVYGYSNVYNCHIIDPYYRGRTDLQFFHCSDSFVCPEEDPEGAPFIRGALFGSFKRLMGDDDLREEDYEAVGWLWSKYFRPVVSFLYDKDGKIFGQVQWLPPFPNSDLSEVIEGVRFITRLRKLDFDE